MNKMNDFELNLEEEMDLEEELNTEENLEEEPDLEEEIDLEENLEEEFGSKDRNKRFERISNKNKERRHRNQIAKKTGAYINKGSYCTSPTSSKKEWKTSSHRQERRKPFDEMETFTPNRREGGRKSEIPKSQYVSLLSLRE